MSEEWAVGDDVTIEGVFVATLLRIEESHSDMYDKDQLQLVFRIDDEGEFQGWELSRWVTKPQGSIRPKMAIYPIVQALLGVSLEGHGPIKREELIGRQAQIMVAPSQKADGTMADKIVSVSKLKGAPAQVGKVDAPAGWPQENGRAKDNARLAEMGLDAAYEKFKEAGIADYLIVAEDGLTPLLVDSPIPLPDAAKIKRVLMG